MRKITFSILGALILASCSSDGQKAETSKPEQKHEENIKENEASGTPGPQEESVNFEELPTINEIMENKEYLMQVETDNQNKRILFFENDNGEKLFKSIYIKHDQRLKVIDLAKDQMVYNEKIS